MPFVKHKKVPWNGMTRAPKLQFMATNERSQFCHKPISRGIVDHDHLGSLLYYLFTIVHGNHSPDCSMILLALVLEKTSFSTAL